MLLLLSISAAGYSSHIVQALPAMISQRVNREFNFCWLSSSAISSAGVPVAAGDFCAIPVCIKPHMGVGLWIGAPHSLACSGLHSGDTLLIGGASVLGPKAAMFEGLCIPCTPVQYGTTSLI